MKNLGSPWEIQKSQHYTQEQDEYIFTHQPIQCGSEGVSTAPSLRWLKNPYETYRIVEI